MTEKTKPITKREHITSISVIAVCSAILLYALFSPIGLVRNVFAVDSWGDDFRNIEVYQYNTTCWNMVYNFTGNGTTSIHDAWATSFFVTVKLNYTYASSAADAASYTRVNCTIVKSDGSATIWNNVALNVTGTAWNDGTAPTNFWYCQKLGNWTSTLPEAGVLYNATFVYQAYY